jgi:hypothetical protein
MASFARYATAVLGAAGILAGCGDFQDRTTVVDLRTLAVQVARPEIRVDPAQLDAPATATLTALVIDPQGQRRPVSYEVLACPRETDAVTAATGRAGAVCKPYDPSSTDLDRSVPVTPPGAPLSTAEGGGPEHQLALPEFVFPRDLLERALMLDPFAARGFPSPIIFQWNIRAGEERETIIKRVIFSLAPEGYPDEPPNNNPEIARLIWYERRDGDGMAIEPRPFDPLDAPPSLAAAPIPEVRLGDGLWIEPEPNPPEVYHTPVLKRGTAGVVTVQELRETLRFGFFASAGTFSPPATNTEPTLLRKPTERLHLESRYTAPQVMPATGPFVKVWIVARDERGGATWTRRTLVLTP